MQRKKKNNLKVGILVSGIKAAGFQNRLLNGTGEPEKKIWGGLVRSSKDTFGNERGAKGLNQLSFKMTQPKKNGKMKLFETEELKGKTIPISTQQIFTAWQKVKAAKGSGGVDGMSIPMVEDQLQKELYQLWNRMASGSYHPKAVKATEITKWDGGKRKLGIPTVTDRVAQQVVKDVLEPELEKIFHPDSYGYRPGKNTHQAVLKCKERCWKYAWVIDLDIKQYFDSIDHTLLMKAIDQHTDQKWVKMYVKRWLTAPIEERGKLYERNVGTPQGGVISPLLSNLFLHYVFDKWMNKHYPYVPFERYADDIIIHCVTKEQAESILQSVTERMEACKLKVNQAKTKIVHCKKQGRQSTYKIVTFDFLGFGFQPRKSKDKKGECFLSYGAGIGKRAKKHIASVVRNLNIHRATDANLDALSIQLAPSTRGWINYFGKINKWAMQPVFRALNFRLVKWYRNKYKSCRKSYKTAWDKLKTIARDYPNLFIHWQYGFIPS